MSEKSKEEQDGLVWLLIGAVGFFLGMSVITGPLGWYFGRSIRRDCQDRNRHVPDTVQAAWVVGIVTTILTFGLILLIIGVAVAALVLAG